MQLWRNEPAPLRGAVLGAYRHLLDSFGTASFQSRIGAAISAIVPLDRFYMSERGGPTQRPTPIAYRIDGVLAGKIGNYFDRYYRRDPVVHALEAAGDGGETVVMRVDAADIVEAEYRHQFFESGGTVERISFVHRACGRWLSLNVARRTPHARFNGDEISALADLSQLLLPLAARQAQLARPPLGVDELDRRFEAYFPALTARERQVCARAAVGMTSEATALDLGVGVGSVQTYRKRAFRRLGISSAFELARLVMH